LLELSKVADDSQQIRCWMRARQARIRSCAVPSHAHGP